MQRALLDMLDRDKQKADRVTHQQQRANATATAATQAAARAARDMNGESDDEDSHTE